MSAIPWADKSRQGGDIKSLYKRLPVPGMGGPGPGSGKLPLPDIELIPICDEDPPIIPENLPIIRLSKVTTSCLTPKS